MTQRIHMFPDARVPASDHGEALIVINQDHAPGRILNFRVYELVPNMDEPHMMVLRDALLADQTRHADAIIKEYGIAVCWMPSPITVTLIDAAASRIIVDNAIAHACWNLELGASVVPSGGFRAIFYNDMHVPRTVRAAMTVTEVPPWVDSDVRVERLEESNRSLQLQLQQLQAAFRKVARGVLETTKIQTTTTAKIPKE